MRSPYLLSNTGEPGTQIPPAPAVDLQRGKPSVLLRLSPLAPQRDDNSSTRSNYVGLVLGRMATYVIETTNGSRKDNRAMTKLPVSIGVRFGEFRLNALPSKWKLFLPDLPIRSGEDSCDITLRSHICEFLLFHLRS